MCQRQGAMGVSVGKGRFYQEEVGGRHEKFHLLLLRLLPRLPTFLLCPGGGRCDGVGWSAGAGWGQEGVSGDGTHLLSEPSSAHRLWAASALRGTLPRFPHPGGHLFLICTQALL